MPIIDICMKDELAKKRPKNGGYIVNMQSSTQGDGTHWTGLYIKNDKGCYFDPFGALPPTEIEKFVKKRKGIKLSFNNHITQDLESSSCGLYCLAFLVFLTRNSNSNLFGTFNTFVNGFGDATKDNETVLKSFFRENINNNKSIPIKLKIFLS
jgi:hypothetical protein